jgi:RNA polymerase sigma-70 factor (ECF subfamily)
MTSETDAGVMARAAAGDREAIAELYDRYAPVVMPVALRIVGTSADAEDVLHDAFVSLGERARHYSAERGSVIAWLVILVRNLSIDRVRRRGRRRALDDANAALAPPPDPAWANPEQAAILAAKRERVLRALSSLAPLHRTTLEMAFFEGLTYPEIAEREGISLGTVKSRASRAITALGEALHREGLGVDDLSSL